MIDATVLLEKDGLFSISGVELGASMLLSVPSRDDDLSRFSRFSFFAFLPMLVEIIAMDDEKLLPRSIMFRSLKESRLAMIKLGVIGATPIALAAVEPSDGVWH